MYQLYCIDSVLFFSQSFVWNYVTYHFHCNFLKTELEGDADEENIKLAYRRLAKFYHPDGLFLTFNYHILNCIIIKYNILSKKEDI